MDPTFAQMITTLIATQEQMIQYLVAQNQGLAAVLLRRNQVQYQLMLRQGSLLLPPSTSYPTPFHNIPEGY